MAEKKVTNPISVRLSESDKDALTQVCIDNNLDRVTIAEGIRFLLDFYRNTDGGGKGLSEANIRQLEDLLFEMKESGLYSSREIKNYKTKLDKTKAIYKEQLDQKFADIIQFSKTK